MRAALKAALDGHQVAVLVPTTILAEQHWNTFRERFAPYPVRIEMLAFRAGSARPFWRGWRRDVMSSSGRIDSSRRTSSSGISALVVDEEHRFGVAHKERLKQLRKAVHVLTLTATPIPRTLSMAMAGIRDLSVIESPPADRLAVETVVCRFDAHVIKEAIERELGRGGQVFVVHNRIQSLPAIVRLIQRLVPRARVAMAHGQLREATLERTMLDYVGGAYDVLVATAIIESGLDIGVEHDHHQPGGPPGPGAALPTWGGWAATGCRLRVPLIPADGRVDETAASGSGSFRS
jgi:transcription-repair coupling factor (superfamily II helicase)